MFGKKINKEEIDKGKINEVVHLNTSFKHFILFSHEFDLIPQKQLEPLKEQIKQALGEKN